MTRFETIIYSFKRGSSTCFFSRDRGASWTGRSFNPIQSGGFGAPSLLVKAKDNCKRITKLTLSPNILTGQKRDSTGRKFLQWRVIEPGNPPKRG